MELLPLLLLRQQYLLIELIWLTDMEETEDPRYETFEWDLHLLTEFECHSLTRFSKSEIPRLADLLRIREVEWLERRATTSEMALAVACVRMSHPRMLREVARLFGRSESWISNVANDVLTFLSERFDKQIEWHPTITLRRVNHFARRLDEYCGASLIWGFINGTSIDICRPTEEQSIFWSGYRKKHVIKFQTIVAPDGLIISCSGPYVSEAAGVRLVTVSKIEDRLRELFDDGDELFLNGDAAYDHCFGMMTGFSEHLTRTSGPARDFNNQMSSIRMGIGRSKMLWPLNEWRLGSEEEMSPVGTYYRATVLLTNCHTCLRGGNQISAQFEC